MPDKTTLKNFRDQQSAMIFGDLEAIRPPEHHSPCLIG
jgi:hypothetical protein